MCIHVISVQVVGINTAIRANAAGIGFAIPIDTAEKAMKMLAAGKRIEHAYMGVMMLSATPESAKLNNDDPSSNVYIPEREFITTILSEYMFVYICI